MILRVYLGSGMANHIKLVTNPVLFDIFTPFFPIISHQLNLKFPFLTNPSAQLGHPAMPSSWSPSPSSSILQLHRMYWRYSLGSVCVYIYNYIYIIIYIMRVYVYIYIYICVYMYICIYVYVYMYVYICIYMCVYVYMCICVCIYIYIHTCMCYIICIYIYYIYVMYIYINVCMNSQIDVISWCVWK